MTTPPPPQGQNPYAQTPPPPVGQQAVQPGVPPQGAPYAPFPAQGAPVPPPPAPAKRGGKKPLRIIAGILVAIIIALVKFGGAWGLGWFFSRSDAETTSVGACMHNDGTDSNADLNEVDCSSSGAQYKVVEKFDDTSDDTKCETVTDATIYYVQSGNAHDVVLCLKEVK
ncbi:hypothetical protein [Streptomyces sp. NPDC002088]|uniref:LppU/SCO3897 family protein n=1 Tax=Streptomyces sp. NPDC002088 TaxID=3154665 RepID=UPI003322F2E5